jgi:hypothetical protein
MVAPVPAQISKLPPRLPVAALRRPLPDSRPVNPLQPLSSLIAAPVLCQNTRVGGTAILVSARPSTAHYPLPTFVNSFASYHIPATPAVSCDYALFCATTRRDPSYFQWLSHSFYRHGGAPSATSVLLNSVPSVLRFSPILGCSRLPTPVFASVCRLFALFPALVSFVFNSLQPLFRKHPGWGYPECS